jgi:hypothetical protein
VGEGLLCAGHLVLPGSTRELEAVDG